MALTQKYRVKQVPTFVFIHGFLGFEVMHKFLRVVPYFRGLSATAHRLGIPCVFPRLPPAATVAERARVLADQLTDIEADFFVLIGHSMGGLDARHLVANFNLSKPVLQVVTLSTPHHGTEVAEWLLTGRGALHRLAQRFWRRALEDLTQEACFCRNTRFEDRSDICYISYAAERQRKDLPFWLRPLARALEEPNDGLVTVSSAEWGKLRGVMKADHFEMVGWSLAPSCEAAERPFAHLALYESIIRDVNGSEELY